MSEVELAVPGVRGYSRKCIRMRPCINPKRFEATTQRIRDLMDGGHVVEIQFSIESQSTQQDFERIELLMRRLHKLIQPKTMHQMTSWRITRGWFMPDNPVEGPDII